MARLPIARGYDAIVDGQIPSEWSADWFSRFLTNWMFRGDLRNATAGPGITIDGQSGQIPTISVTAAIAPVEVTGSRASGAALVSLLAALEAAGIIVDNTTA